MSAIPLHTVSGRPCRGCYAVSATPAPYKTAMLIASSGAFSIQKLPSDPIGSATLLLTNVVNGSALEIEDSTDGTSLYSDTVSGTSAMVSLSVYSTGSTRNTVRIKVRKGSASPFYQPFETLAALTIGSQSIYVSQIPDE